MAKKGKDGMIKGIQKQMIMIKTPKSRIFEAAYLVLRRDADNEPEEKEMIEEANKIVDGICRSSAQKHKEKRRAKAKRIALFLSGTLVGGLVFLLGILASAFMRS